MIFVLLSLGLTFADRPVIRLEDSYLHGNVRRPNLVELEGSKLDRMVEAAALKSLIRLENQLLKPHDVDALKIPRTEDSK